MIPLPDPHDIDRIIHAALAEDIGPGDVTSQRLIPESLQARLAFVNREEITACGAEVAQRVFHTLDASLQVRVHVRDGQKVEKGTCIIEVSGAARPILTAERTALNLFQRMCSVATETAKYVEAVKGTKAVILDTRKTMPGLRMLDKYAVRAGGGQNHRMGLYDMVMIKDNHIAICGGIKAALERAGHDVPVETECDTLQQVQEALEAGATCILLDNMENEKLRQAVAMNRNRAKLEASGNMSLARVRSVAETGVDYISVGSITHSVRQVDIGLDIVVGIRD
jgi:nicotinate-nucleotide pyrophosphorylase (carboxylating)